MGILGRQQPMQYGPILGGQPTYVLGGRPTYASMYPPEIVNAQNPLPSYAHLERDPAPPDLAPTQLVKGMAGAVGDRLMQAHEAMPWGGNNPQAIGYDPQAGTIDPSVMVPFAADVAGMATTGSLAAPAVQGGVGMGIRAYHGSPHDFDRFSMDKIGTGEGAQAYGHGLYFAENEGVARGYKDRLSNPPPRDADAHKMAQYHLALAGGDVNAAKAAIEESKATWAANTVLTQAEKDRIIRMSDAQIAELDKVTVAPGRMYEVDINASPDEFLDWDKPLSEQPPKVREALSQVGLSTSQAWRPGEAANVYERVGPRGVEATVRQAVRIDKPEWKATYDTLYGNGTKWFPTEAEAKAWIDKQAPIEGGRGAEVYQGMRKGEQSDAAITEALRAAGIKGIRYKDAGSRRPDWNILSPAETTSGKWRVNQAGHNGQNFDTEAEARAFLEKNAPTSNYVVFDDNIIDILKKYGIAGLTAGGAGAAMLGGTQDASAAPASYSTGGRF